VTLPSSHAARALETLPAVRKSKHRQHEMVLSPLLVQAAIARDVKDQRGGGKETKRKKRSGGKKLGHVRVTIKETSKSASHVFTTPHRLAFAAFRGDKQNEFYHRIRTHRSSTEKQRQQQKEHLDRGGRVAYHLSI
jgi:hypothetical protein